MIGSTAVLAGSAIDCAAFDCACTPVAAPRASRVAIDSWIRRIRMALDRPSSPVEVPAIAGSLTLSDLCFFNNPPKLSDSLKPLRRPALRDGAAEQGFDLLRGEPVCLAAELAVDLGAAADDRGPGLSGPQGFEHRRHPFARAGAGEAQRSFPQQADVLFREQTRQQGLDRPLQQLVRAQGVEQQAGAVPAVVVAFV